jgi:hypothetical protein
MLVACQSSPAPTTTAEPQSSAAPAQAGNVARYGAPIAAGASVKLSNVMNEPEKFKAQPVIVEAEVRRACSRKGCWMELSESLDKNAPGCRVTFKDYGFFVPTDSAGSHARVQGNVTVETVAAGTVQHLEEEGARFAKKNPDGTADEVRFVATGVELSKKLN